MTRPTAIERKVEARAAGRCEYCRMHQSLQGATFHVEHIMPRSRGGQRRLDNLAWACPGCNLRKSARQQAEDPQTGEMVSLFNPRTDIWSDHFSFHKYRAIALSATGRATLAALGLNHSRRINIRKAEELFHLFPPDDVP
jgi:hypothetical protein